jgi:hypothetical protein
LTAHPRRTVLTFVLKEIAMTDTNKLTRIRDLALSSGAIEDPVITEVDQHIRSGSTWWRTDWNEQRAQARKRLNLEDLEKSEDNAQA